MLENILLDLGGKALATVIGKKFGPEMGDLTNLALEALGQSFGVEPKPDVIEKAIVAARDENAESARGAVAYAEATIAPQLLAQAELQRAGNEQQKMTNELLLAKLDTGTDWRKDWLYAWQWFLLFVWFWTVVLVHVLNAVIRIVSGATAESAVNLPAPDLGVLVTLTGLYLGLHMGGHTVLELMRGGVIKGGDKT